MRPRIVVATFFAILVTACDGPDQSERAGTDALQQAKDAQSRWKELCASMGGVEIYRTVAEVEGVLLRGVIPNPRGRIADPMWPAAAFITEFGDGYISTFLGYEHSGSRTMPVSPERRGYVTLDYQDANPSNVPGYRFVDVIDEETGERFRYTRSYDLVGRKDVNAPSIKLQLEKNPDMDLDVYRWGLSKALTQEPLPRYAVDFEAPIIMDQREQGIAVGIIKVVDLEDGSILAKLTRYSWSLPRSGANPNPWAAARWCPGYSGSRHNTVRTFVDTVLVPMAAEFQADN